MIFFMIFFLDSKVILISTLNDKYKIIKSKIQQIKRGSDSLTRLLGGSWNLLSLTWKKCWRGRLDDLPANMADVDSMATKVVGNWRHSCWGGRNCNMLDDVMLTWLHWLTWLIMVEVAIVCAGLCYRSICCWRRRSSVVSYGVDLLLVRSKAANGWPWRRLW